MSIPEAAGKAKTWILDGFLGNGDRFEALRRRVAEKVGPADIWRYQTSGVTPIDYLGRVFRDILEWERGPVHLIGYSMGGLVVRAALAHRPLPALSKVVFLNVPHHGTAWGHVVPLPAVRQMQPHSALLNRLNRQRWEVPTLNVWCPGDLMILPGWSSRFPLASREEVCRVPAHLWPVYAPYWHARAVDFLMDY
ncbi:MAG: esterase/lipase family protein [Candidatus Methylacidiphilales bacterium]